MKFSVSCLSLLNVIPVCLPACLLLTCLFPLLPPVAVLLLVRMDRKRALHLISDIKEENGISTKTMINVLMKARVRTLELLYGKQASPHSCILTLIAEFEANCSNRPFIRVSGQTDEYQFDLDKGNELPGTVKLVLPYFNDEGKCMPGFVINQLPGGDSFVIQEDGQYSVFSFNSIVEVNVIIQLMTVFISKYLRK